MGMSSYSILGVPEGASLDECKTAYRVLCKKHHPDMGGSIAKFQEVNKAWEDIQKGTPSFTYRGEITHQSIFTFVKV